MARHGERWVTTISLENNMTLGTLLDRISGGDRIIIEEAGRVLFWDQVVYFGRSGIDRERMVKKIKIDTNVYKKELDKQGNRKKNLRSISAEDMPDMEFRDVDLQFQLRIEIE